MQDLISRQAAIDAIEITPFDDYGDYMRTRELIEQLPSAQPDLSEYSDKLWRNAYERGKRDALEESQWIPCSERLPEEPYGCLVTVWDTNPITMDEFENILPYFVGWDGEQWNDGDGEQCPFEVIAWKPLPNPYKGGRNEID